VSQYGYALQYVKEQTDKICKAAVSQNGDAWRYFSKKIYSKLKVTKTEEKQVCRSCGKEL